LAGQYTQVTTPFDQEDFVTSFTPLEELITEVTTYLPFCHAMVEMVVLPLACGSSHFPARPGTASWPAIGWEEAVVNGARVAVVNGSAGSMTGGSVADERVADGNAVGKMVGGTGVTDAAITKGSVVASGVGPRELHAARIAIPAIAPINPSQNFLCTSIYFLHL